MQSLCGREATAPVPDPVPHWTTTTPYAKLRGSEIRLLQILPLSNNPTARLKSKLSTHNLLAAPSFTALSYTWGVPHREIHKLRKSPSSPTHRIECNGREARIGENLFDFLLHCACDTSGNLQGYMWVDALSINQEDVEERNEQVKLMSKIYQNSTNVLVWLGPEDISTISAMKLMKELLRLEPWDRLRLHPIEVTEHHPNSLLDLSNWQALSQFFQREWFTRAWIIQEVVLARSVSILCSEHSLSWAELSLLSQFLSISSWTVLLRELAGAEHDQRAIIMGHNTPARIAAAQRTWLSGHDNSFLYALIRARSSKSGDPRDKVYSQLGLGNARIIPDYHASVADVYITTAEYILNHSKSLLLLTCIEGTEFQQVPGLPSWVPDWSMGADLGLRITGYRNFNAAGDLPKQYELSRRAGSTPILAVQATKFDTIVDICEPKSELRDGIHSSHLWDMISQLNASYTSVPGRSREEVVWRTLVTNRERGGLPTVSARPIHPASSDLLEPSFRAWLLWRYATTSHEIDKFPQASLTSHLIPTEDEMQEARIRAGKDREYLADLKRRASHYDVHFSHALLLRPFITEHGYFGLGTQCLQSGDTIWIVPGCPVPLILRRINGSQRHRLVGGTYVHGFMSGEILKWEGLEFTMVSLE